MQNYTPVRRLSRNSELCAVVADRFDRAGIERFLTEFQLFGSFRLFVNKRIAVLVISGEISRRSVTTNVAIDTLSIDIEFAPCVIGKFVFDRGHHLSEYDFGKYASLPLSHKWNAENSRNAA